MLTRAISNGHTDGCSLFLRMRVLHLNTSTVLFFLCRRRSAALLCHPVPAVMGKGCGRASHQYSATVRVQTHTKYCIFTPTSRMICKDKRTNKQTCINVCVFTRQYTNWYSKISFVWQVISTWLFSHTSWHNVGFLCFPKPTYREARAAQRLYWTAGTLRNEWIYISFISLLSQLRPPDLNTSHRKWPHTDRVFFNLCHLNLHRWHIAFSELTFHT